MSLAEDLLNSLPEDQPAVTSADPATEPHIVINPDRTVTVPESLLHIAVERDHNIETVTFDCPRHWDGHDLSQMKLRIVFQRPDGHREPHLAENVRVDSDDVNVIHFDWTISNNVTLVRGAISFLVCAKLTNAEGVSEREWHTRLNQDLIVDEGMECSGEEIVEQNPDIIESILVQLDELKNTGSNSGQNIITEPAEDDIPCVYFTVKGGMPFTKDEGEVRALMQYISKTQTMEQYVTAKVQGGSSANHPDYKKRNWTIKIYKDNTYDKKEKLRFKGWPAMNKFVLKAGWVIPGHTRNVGAAKIWGQIMRSRADYATLPDELRNSPNQGATDGFHVRIFINGVYWGIYDWIVAKDQLFGQDKDNLMHSILNSESNYQSTCAFSTTSPAIAGNWSEELLDSMTDDTKTSMENWIKFVAGSSDEEFVANAENYFDVQSVIDAICFDRILMPVDNMSKNQIVFKYGTKWYMGKWDLDAILGLPPVAGQNWYSYDTAYQEGYVAYKNHGITNMLYSRVESLFLDRFTDNYWRLRSGPLSENNLVRTFGQLSDRLRSIEGLLAEENASTTGNGEFTGMPNTNEDTIQQIRDIVVKRCAYMDSEIMAMGGKQVLYSLPEHTTFNGTSDYIDTGVSLLDEAKDFTILFDLEPSTQTLAAATVFHCLTGAISGNGLYYGGVGNVGFAALRGYGDDDNWHNPPPYADWPKVEKVAIVCQGGIPTLFKFLNTSGNVNVCTINEGGVFTPVERTLLIGAHRNNAGGYSGYYAGTINEFIVYNYAMTEDEVDAYLTT